MSAENGNVKQLGTSAELLVASELERRGFTISKPMGEHSPYDLVCDVGGVFVSVQVKSAHTGADDGAHAVTLGNRPKKYDILIAVVYSAAGPVFLIAPTGMIAEETSLFYTDENAGERDGVFIDAWDMLTAVAREKRGEKVDFSLFLPLPLPVCALSGTPANRGRYSRSQIKLALEREGRRRA